MILVTGATGKVGTHLVRHLAAAGERPRALVRDPDKAHDLFGDSAQLLQGDYGHPETVARAMDGVDAVFVLTATSTEQFDQERAVIDAASRAGVRLAVKLSVTAAGEDSPMEHGRWQGRANQVLIESGMDYTVLQLAFLMQTLSGMVRQGVILSSAGDGQVAMVDASDVAAVAAQVLMGRAPDAVNSTLVLTGPQALSFDDVAKVLSAESSLTFRHIRLSRAELIGGMERFGLGGWYAEDIAAFNDLMAAGAYATVTDTVERLTGRPPGSLAQFARETGEVLFPI